MPDIYYNNPEIRQSVGRAGRIGQETEDEFLRRARSFDPMQSLRDYSTGAFNSFRRDLGQDMSKLRGQQVGMGRLRTGFGQGDEDRLVTGSLDRLNDAILGQSMNATQMQQNNTNMLGQYGLDRSNTHLEATTGLAASKAAQDATNKASKRGMWGNIAGAGLMAAGTALGGPLGGMIGGGIGKLFSDEDLKEGIETRGGALERVSQMRGVDFNYNDAGQALSGMDGGSGVVAQEMEQADPNAVSMHDSGFRQVDPWVILADLIEAVGELEGRLPKAKGKSAKRSA